MVATFAAETGGKLITDVNLEQAIRLQLKKPSGALTREDLLALRSLYPKDTTKPIASLDGLEYAANLSGLYLPGFGLSDLRPLAKLNKIAILGLNHNRIADLGPLGQLTKLEKLVIDDNLIENLSPLSPMTSMTDLLASGNRIASLDPLSGKNKA